MHTTQYLYELFKVQILGHEMRKTEITDFQNGTAKKIKD